MGLLYRLLIAVIVGGVVAGGTATYLANAAVETAVVAAPAASVAPSPAAERRFSFDGESLGALSVAAISGGQVRAETHGVGQAVRFPARCTVYGDRTCPRVVLESRDIPNPGTAPVRFGATVLMEADDTDAGENVLQKGFSRGHGQFKLQVDGVAGQPSCVLVGSGSSRIYVVTARASVSDGRWHAIECVRTGSDLSVVVAGAISGQIRVPAALSIVNGDPLRIGGKGLSPNNDQYHGVIDDVFVVIGG
jgi:Concanavalin A-like lectin/glucanases superfamily